MSELGNFDTSGDFLAVAEHCQPYPSERAIRSVAYDPNVQTVMVWQVDPTLDPETQYSRAMTLRSYVKARNVLPESDATIALICYEDMIVRTTQLGEAYAASIPRADNLARIASYICSRDVMYSGKNPTAQRKTAYAN